MEQTTNKNSDSKLIAEAFANSPEFLKYDPFILDQRVEDTFLALLRDLATIIRFYEKNKNENEVIHFKEKSKMYLTKYRELLNSKDYKLIYEVVVNHSLILINLNKYMEINKIE